MIYGGRSSLVIGLASIGIALILGVSFGILAGYYPDAKTTYLIIWITDILMAFPTIILGAIVGIVLGPRGYFNTIVAIAIAFTPSIYPSGARKYPVGQRGRLYSAAAESIGDVRLCGSYGIHLFPNIISSGHCHGRYLDERRHYD